MFLDEARVMMRLKHPNVCHVYKFGKEDGNHYIAMEWVNGASLGKVIRRARKAGGLPLPIACKVVALIAQALDHAHAAKDESGRPLGIVHRDVTPDNLMISYDGSVKLLDFGIAKADARAHKTQAGVVKGKFAYMAPEQCRAKELDHRVDVFALGVCLYEALTGKPLYRRETEYETMEAIVRGPVPKLAERLPNAPPELEAIIARCLAKSPEERFASAGELEEALERFLGARGEVVSGRRITELMDKLFKEEMKRGPALDTTPFGSSYHLDVSDPAAPGFTEQVAPGELGALPLPNLDVAPLAGTVIPDDPRQGAGRPWTATEPSAHRPAPTAPPRVRAPVERESGGGITKWLVIGGAIALLAAGAYFGRSFLVPAEDADTGGPAPVLTGTLSVASEPPGATLFVDDREVGTTPATVPALATGSHRVRLVLAGHHDHEGALEIRANETHAVTQTLAPVAPEGPVAHGRLTLTSRPPAEVFLRGESLGRTPLRDVEVPAGVLPLELETPDGQRHRRGVMVRADDSTSTHLDLTE
jgi:serine/threonine-protein kinase